MKKVLYCTLAAAGVLSLASCSNDDMPMPAGDGVNITVKLPRDMATRGTFGDGTDAGDRAVLDNLQWSVFEVTADGTPTLVFSDGRSAFGSSQTEELVNIPLAKGKTYQVAFYADDKDNTFVTYSDGNITVDYKNAKSNTAAEDAFIGKSKVFTVSGAYSETVTLTRPFAQLNWGTDDTKAKVLEKIIGSLTAEVSVTQGLYTGMNVLTGETTGDPLTTPVNFGTVEFSALPAQTFPVQKTEEGAEPYALIAMDYLLTGNGTVDCELSFNNGLDPVTVNAAPVQVNHRTNIYGSLLTAPGEFNIIVDNNFQDPDLDVTVETKKPEQDDNGVYLITTQGELAWLAEQVNGGDKLNGKTFSLQNDIYLVGKWTPIGGGSDFNIRFSGKFLGNGNTIHNMVVDSPTAERVGFFGASNGQIENLNFDNASVTGHHWAGVVVGYSDNETGSAYIKNCNVSNSSVTLIPANNDNGDKGGLIIGYMATNDQVEGCTVTDCTLQGYRDLGGIIGYSNGSVIKNNKVSGLKILVDNSMNYKGYTTLGTGGNDANPVIGEKAGGTDSGNTYERVQIGALINSQEALVAALKGFAANSTLDVYLADGTYTLPAVTAAGATLNVTGASKNVVVNTGTAGAVFKDLNFTNVTIKGNGTYTGFQHLSGTTSFTDCDLTGSFCGYSPNLVFTGCDFTTNSYAIQTYASTKADFTDCSFTNTTAAKAILVYTEQNDYKGIDVNVTNCTFTAPATVLRAKGVVEIHTELFNGTQEGTVTINNSKYTGAFTGWVRELNNTTKKPTEYWKVVINN